MANADRVMAAKARAMSWPARSRSLGWVRALFLVTRGRCALPLGSHTVSSIFRKPRFSCPSLYCPFSARRSHLQVTRITHKRL
eukprot:2474928-Prymnesium_polylepis.1